MAEKPNDIVCRRLPIANTDRKLAAEVLPTIVELMAKEKKWGGSQKKKELEEAIQNLERIL